MSKVKLENKWSDVWKTPEYHAFFQQIPEFTDITKNLNERLWKFDDLILTAKLEEKIVAALIGYEKSDQSLYLWMGAVLPEFRRQGLMSGLLDCAQWWAKNSNYWSTSLKVYPRSLEMRQLIAKLGYRAEEDGINYRKDLRFVERVPFEQTSFFQDRERWDLQFSWIVKERKAGIIKYLEHVGAEKFIHPAFCHIILYESQELYLLPEEKYKQFRVEDGIEYDLNAQGKLAWLIHPGYPLYLRNLSLEERKKGR